jgi:hypothetical protein
MRVKSLNNPQLYSQLKTIKLINKIKQSKLSIWNYKVSLINQKDSLKLITLREPLFHILNHRIIVQ